MRRLATIIIVVLSVVAVKAQAADSTAMVVRPVMSAYMVNAGSAHLADTYLSPLKYSGQHYGLSYSRLQAMRFCPENWVMQLDFALALDRTFNTARNATIWGLDADFGWGMMRRWKVIQGLSLGVGGYASANIGCLYTSRNGNNPASAKAALMLNARGYAAYNFKIGRLPIALRYQATLPVIGAFFSPAYGELYYEIYLGNDKGLAHCGWWGNYLGLSNELTADLKFGATWLRVGYRGDYLTTKINHITTRRFTHSAVLGVSGEWMSINPRRQPSANVKMISAAY